MTTIFVKYKLCQIIFFLFFYLKYQTIKKYGSLMLYVLNSCLCYVDFLMSFIESKSNSSPVNEESHVPFSFQQSLCSIQHVSFCSLYWQRMTSNLNWNQRWLIRHFLTTILTSALYSYLKVKNHTDFNIRLFYTAK